MLIYPLEWPIGWVRGRQRYRSRFGAGGRGETLAHARDLLIAELLRLEAENISLTTNIRVNTKTDNWYADPEPPDHGAACYFRVAGQPRALACDKWDRVADNIRALALHVEAIRGQSRWGVGTIDQALGGYKALPAMGAAKLWYEVLGLPHTANETQIKAKRLKLLGELHPDKLGGDAARAAEVNQAYQEALTVLAREARAS